MAVKGNLVLLGVAPSNRMNQLVRGPFARRRKGRSANALPGTAGRPDRLPVSARSSQGTSRYTFDVATPTLSKAVRTGYQQGDPPSRCRERFNHARFGLAERQESNLPTHGLHALADFEDRRQSGQPRALPAVCAPRCAPAECSVTCLIRERRTIADPRTGVTSWRVRLLATASLPCVRPAVRCRRASAACSGG
jgi:hypothetical protein